MTALCDSLVVAVAVGMQMAGNGRPPPAQSNTGQPSTGQATTSFGANMVPVLQGRPGVSTHLSYPGQPAAGMTACSFMPVMQHQVGAAHTHGSNVSPLQPQGQNGPDFQGQFAQPFQFAPSMPQFQSQPSQQQQQRQQQMQHHGQFVRSPLGEQISSSQNSLGQVPDSSSSLTQNV